MHIFPPISFPHVLPSNYSPTPTRYRDRQTGTVVVEHVPGQSLLRWFYGTNAGHLVFRAVLNRPLGSHLYGWWKQRPWTRRQIRPFVDRYRIDLDEVEYPLSHYSSFNDFFIRRLKPGARPCDPGPERLCCPADGKVLVYPQLAAEDVLPVKSSRIAARELLAKAIDPTPYHGGAALVVRLAPYDYHRFHFPADGQAEQTQWIDGTYHSVNPIALARVPDVFHRNRRSVCELTTTPFGRIAYIEVGAINVASIVQTYSPGPCERGQEKGFFQFGGSTVVLLFEPGAIAFDSDLVADSAAGLEVHVRTGAGVGGRA